MRLRQFLGVYTCSFAYIGFLQANEALKAILRGNNKLEFKVKTAAILKTDMNSDVITSLFNNIRYQPN